MNIHSRLRALIMITLVPIAIFGIAGSFVLVDKERNTLARGVTDQARAIMSAIDIELFAAVGPLQLLAQSPALDRGDLAAFREEAQRALEARRGDWSNVLVSRPDSGEMLMNLLSPPGASIGTPEDAPTIRQAAESGKATVSAVIVGPILKRPLFGVRVPVMRDGKARYVLSAVVETEVIARLIDRQSLPASYVVGVLDRKYRFVVRRPATDPGNEFAGDSLRESLSTEGEGWRRGKLVDGTDVYRAFKRSPLSGWSTSIAVPQSVISQDMLGTWLLFAGFLAAAVVGFWIAWALAARITRPITALARAAPALGRGEVTALPPASSIDEVRELSQALHDAAVAIHDRDQRQRAAEQSLREADRAKNEFLAMLGHELRNPLSSVANATQLLAFAEHRPEVIAGVRDVLGRQVAHITHLLDDLLEVGRLTGGKIRLERAAVDLGALAEVLLSTWRSGGRFAQRDVHANLGSAWVWADRVRIEQVLSNLVDNALKFTAAEGQIDIVVRTDANRAVLEIRDNGDGIDADLLHRVFDLFVQGERNLAREQGGLGIGLTMAQRIVDLHDGTITVASAGAGKGATFTVSLPAIDPPPVPSTRVPAMVVGRRKILVVEDNVDARESLVALLEASGHQVRGADSGRAAITAVQSSVPDVALIDIGLPDIDGYAVARHLRAIAGAGSLRLIAMTGYGSPEHRRRSDESGFDAHLVKPLDLSALEQLLERREG